MKLKSKLSNKAKNQIATLINEAMRAYLIDQLNIAEQRCQKILQIQVNNPDACNLLGKIAEKRGEPDKAKTFYEQGQKYHPNHLGLLASLGMLFSSLQNHESAIQNWRRLLSLSPKNPDAWQALSVEYYLSHRWDKSEAAAKNAIKLATNRGPLHTNLGRILRMQRKHDEAIQSLNKAIKLTPLDTDAWYELAMSSLERDGMDEALETFNKLLSIDSQHIPTISMLLRFKKVTAYDDIMKKAEALLSDPATTKSDHALLSFSLGKAWEDLKEYDKSFIYYAKGNELRRDDITFNIEDERKHSEDLKALFTKDLFSEHQLNDRYGESLLFVVGMPRTGSTLLDKILAAHPKVIDTGETDELREVIGLLTSNSSKCIDIDATSQLTNEQLKSSAKEYIERLSRYFGESEKYIDKTLPNLWLIGFIHLLFPKAKILHCTRNPLDNCFSIFSTDFEGSFFRFAYNLQDLGEYYQTYIDMMAHWRSVLPTETLYEISYEALVAAPEEQSRSLVAFCDLEWDDACLNYHTSKGSVQSSSLAQVRQPIYNSSIGRWKRYETHLQPLIKALGDSAKQS